MIPSGRGVLGELLAGNPATASSLLMRASVVEPIPAEIPYTDWWFAARAALVSEIAYVAEPRTLYRFHGGNITLGVEGAATRARAAQGADVRALVPAPDAARAPRRRAGWRRRGRSSSTANASWPRWARPRVDARRRAATARRARGEAAGGGVARAAARRRAAAPRRGGGASRAAGAARAGDRARGAARRAARAAARPARRRATASPPRSPPRCPPRRAARGAGPRVALAYADELVADPALLAAWARDAARRPRRHARRGHAAGGDRRARRRRGRAARRRRRRRARARSTATRSRDRQRARRAPSRRRRGSAPPGSARLAAAWS